MTASRHEPTLVPHARYWDSSVVVERHRTPAFLFWYERELVRRMGAALAAEDVPVRLMHVVGCGAGREIPLLCDRFAETRVVASDIAPHMLESCAARMAAAGLAGRVSMRRAAARELAADGEGAQLVLALNNVLSYVSPQVEREASLRALHGLLQRGGMLGGVVHHRWGRVLKSAYFALQRLGVPLAAGSEEPGDRVARFDGMHVRVHYYTRDELRLLLERAGFTRIVVRSLAELAQEVGRRYHAALGDDNLVFSAAAA